MEKRLLTIDEFCQITHMGRTQLYKKINAGELQAIKAGRRTFITVASMEEWIDSLPYYPWAEDENEE